MKKFKDYIIISENKDQLIEPLKDFQKKIEPIVKNNKLKGSIIINLLGNRVTWRIE